MKKKTLLSLVVVLAVGAVLLFHAWLFPGRFLTPDFTWMGECVVVDKSAGDESCLLLVRTGDGYTPAYLTLECTPEWYQQLQPGDRISGGWIYNRNTHQGSLYSNGLRVLEGGSQP